MGLKRWKLYIEQDADPTKLDHRHDMSRDEFKAVVNEAWSGTDYVGSPNSSPEMLADLQQFAETADRVAWGCFYGVDVTDGTEKSCLCPVGSVSTFVGELDYDERDRELDGANNGSGFSRFDGRMVDLTGYGSGVIYITD